MRKATSKLKVKSKGKGNARQAKISAQLSQKEDTSPSPFAEVIEPKIPPFSVPPEKKPKVPTEKAKSTVSAKSSKGQKQGKLNFQPKEVKSVSTFTDDEDEESQLKLSKDKPVATHIPQKRTRKAFSVDSDEDSLESGPDSDFAIKTTKKAPAVKAPARKKNSTKKTVSKSGKKMSKKEPIKSHEVCVLSASDNDEGEDSEDVEIRRKRGAKQTQVQKVAVCVYIYISLCLLL